MKKYLIASIILISSICKAGYQTTNLDFLWNGEYVESGGKFYAKDSITDAIYTSVEFIGIDTSLNYLSGKSGGFVAWWGDTIPINCIYQNQNLADTTFVKWEEQTLNEDNTENSPFRITYIAHYSSTQTDTDNFFGNSLVLTPSMHTVCASGCGDTTINLAIAVGSATDTIIVYDADLIETDYINDNKGMYVQCVGNVKIKSTGSTYVYFMSAAGSVLKNAQLYGEEQANVSLQISFANCVASSCYVSGGVTYDIRNSSTNFLAEKTVTLSDNSITSVLGHPINVDQCNFKNSVSACLYHLDGSGTSNVSYSNFNSTSGLRTVWARHDDTLIYTGNYITGTTTNAYYENSPLNFPQYVEFKYNTIVNQGDANNGAVYLSGDDDAKYILEGNIFNLDNVSSVAVNNINTNSTYENNTFNITNTVSSGGAVAVSSSTATIDTFNFTNNVINTSATAGYSVKVGTEATGTFDDKIHSVIEGNIINGGGSIATNTNHSIFIGHNINPTVRYNYVINSGYGSVFKHTSGDYTSENISYNIYDSCNFGDRIKGADSVDVYNHTIYDCNQGFVVTDNDGTGSANGCNLKNNIVTDCAVIYSIGANASVISDYNILHNGTMNGNDFATWQGLGYDANSYNTDPNFKSSTELWPLSPSNAIGNGLDLGITYNKGLNKLSAWPDAVVLKTQLTDWAIGAYVIGKPIITRSQLRIIGFGNKTIIYQP